MKQSTLEEFLSQYATVENALEYDRVADKIYFLADITGLRCDHPAIYVLEDKLVKILDIWRNR